MSTIDHGYRFKCGVIVASLGSHSLHITGWQGEDTANITEYHIISKLILQRIIIQKFMMIRQLFDVKIFQLKGKNFG